MPYKGEPPGYWGHSEVASNPEFQDFLKGCEPIEGPSPDAAVSLLKRFQPYTPAAEIPDHLLAIDGGEYVSSVSPHFPSREVLHIRIGSVLLDLARLRRIGAESQYTVDPFELRRIEEQTSALTLWFPGANILREGTSTPQQGFRACLRESMVRDSTKLGGRMLLDALYDGLAARAATEGALMHYDPSTDEILIPKCPNTDCPEKTLDPAVRLRRDQEMVPCPHCGEFIYATDALRLHEAFSDHQGNQGLVSRTRNLSEHLVLLHYLLYLSSQNPHALPKFAFLMDGPLAIFGEAAGFHRALMRVTSDLYHQAEAAGVAPPVIFGVQKSGAVLEFAQSLDRIPPPAADDADPVEAVAAGRAGTIPKGTILPISDDLRFTYITPKAEEKRNVHGDETYYGQDMIVKTHKGRLFVINVAYPFGSKGSAAFKENRFDIEAYPGLERVLSVLEMVESGLYGQSTVAQMLAHRFASISRSPGGRVLDIMAQQSIGS